MTRRTRAGLYAITAIIVFLLSPLALADEEVSVTTELIAEVRESLRSPEGQEVFRYEPATVLAQGQIVYYTLRIHNPTPVFISNVSVVQRIPANTTYLNGSAAGPGAEVTFSIDGGQTFKPARALKVKEDGGMKTASPEHYTHIRWSLGNPLSPGSIALARFQAVFR